MAECAFTIANVLYLFRSRVLFVVKAGIGFFDAGEQFIFGTLTYKSIAQEVHGRTRINPCHHIKAFRQCWCG